MVENVKPKVNKGVKQNENAKIHCISMFDNSVPYSGILHNSRKINKNNNPYQNLIIKRENLSNHNKGKNNL